MNIELAPEFASTLTAQTYPPASHIEDVRTHSLRKNRSEKGAFMEYLRLGEAGVQHLPGPSRHGRSACLGLAQPRQRFSHSRERHSKRDLVRTRGATAGRTDGLPGLKCHAWCAAQAGARQRTAHVGTHSQWSGTRLSGGPRGRPLLYNMDAQFDLADPSEGRLPCNLFGEELWAEDRG